MNQINNKYRCSKLRTHIYQLLCDTDQHPNADEIYQEIRKTFPQVSLGSIYRNLQILQQQGKIQLITNSNKGDCFDAVVHDHAHFQCQNCGRISDCDLPCKLNKQLQKFVEKDNCRWHFRLSGVCPQCQHKNNY